MSERVNPDTSTLENAKVVFDDPSWRRLAMVWALGVTMVTIAQVTHQVNLIFPECTALALGAWGFRHAAWLKRPWHIVMLPPIAAFWGVLLIHLGGPQYVQEAVTLGIITAALVILRSALTPTLSAGLLPIVLHIQSWEFVASVLAISLITGLSVYGRRRSQPDAALAHSLSPSFRVVGIFVIAAMAWIAVAQWGGHSVLVIPPLLVFFYDLLRKPDATKTSVLSQVAVLVMAAALGTGLVFIWPTQIIVVAGVTLAMTVVVMRLTRVWVGPALAMGLLPIILPPDVRPWFPMEILVVGILLMGIVLGASTRRDLGDH